jgi:predicted Na+-dependent transporter
MLEARAVLADLGILTFVVATMAALGMRLTISQIMGPLRGWILPIKALVANFVLVPAFALAIRAVFPLSDGFGIGLILMATAAGAPFLPPLVQIAKGEVAASVGVLVLLMGTTVFYLPLVLPLLLPGVQVSPLDIAKSLVLLMLIPLAIGLFVNRRFPRVAARLQRIVSIIGNIGLVIGVVALLPAHRRLRTVIQHLRVNSLARDIIPPLGGARPLPRRRWVDSKRIFATPGNKIRAG